MYGDSAPECFQSRRVSDWTLLYFKLQPRIPDQGWQTMLNRTKLRRTGAGYYLYLFAGINTVYLLHLLDWSGKLGGGGGGIRLRFDTEVLSSNINQLMTGPKGTVSFVLGLDKFCS